MKYISSLDSRLVALLATACVAVSGSFTAHAQIIQTYAPTAWVNDTSSPNANYTVTEANTSHPTYQNTGAERNSLFGNSPIGATITLNKPGDTAILTAQVTLGGDASATGNVQYRLGMVYQGANAMDTGWGGYFVGNPTGGDRYIYMRNIPNTGIYASGSGATLGTSTDFVYAGGWGAATYDFMLSVTRLGEDSALVMWRLAGLAPNTYQWSGRYTNSSVSTRGGFSFDQIGFLGGSGIFNSASTDNVIAYTNVLVTVGSFGDGTWANDANDLWSVTNNWANGVAANGAGFIADFSQVNLAADRTVTLDSSRSIGPLHFGATSGSTNNWLLDAISGSTLTLDSARITTPSIAVSQNTATINLSLVSSNGLTKTGAGTLVLRGNNTFVGTLNLNDGALNFQSSANLQVSSDAISTINFGGGTLQWASGNTLDISSSGIPINFGGTGGIDTGPNNVTFANSFGDGGVGGLTKLGTGTLTLNNSVSYTGTTTISNGVLALSGSSSISSSTNINIGPTGTLNVTGISGLTLASAQTLRGSGTVNGNLTDTSSTVISPGGSGTAGTLTVNGNLNLSGSGALYYDLTNSTAVGGGANDLIVVTGNLTLNSGTAVNLSFLAGSPAPGVYTIMQVSGLINGDPAITLVPPTLGSRYTVTFAANNSTSPKQVTMTITGSPQPLVWTGANGVQWDFSSINWSNTLSHASGAFSQGDYVTFDDSGNSSAPIDLATTLTPGSVVVNGTSTYTLGSSSSLGSLAGAASLTKNGSGTLILDTVNSYGGATVINGGTLQVGGPVSGGISGSLGIGPVTNNAALVFNRADDYTYANAIYGTGSITNIGSAGTVTLSGSISGSGLNMAGYGVMVLSASNSYTGQTLVSSGSLHPRDSAALGASAAGTVVQNGAQLYIDANIDILGESLSLAGAGPATDGALRKGSGGTTTLGGVITLTADTRLQLDGGSTLNLTHAAGINAPDINLTLGADAYARGNITGPLNLGSGSLTKEGGGTWTLAPTNTFTGKTVINGGILAISAKTALGPASTFISDYVTLNGGSLGVTTNVTFDDGLRGFTVNGTAGGFDVSAGLTLVVSNEITGAGTLTKSGSGTLVLRGTHRFSGTLNVDSGGNAVNDGIVRVASSAAIANVVSPIAIRNTQGGNSTVELDGSSGNIIVSQDITLNGRSPAVPAIVNVAGTNTLAGAITMGAGGGQYRIQSDSGLLTINGIMSFSITTPETLTFQGNGNLSVNGPIEDGTAIVSVAKNGDGVLTLAGTNSYSDSTIINGGTLNLAGSISGTGMVTVAGGILSGTGTINIPVTVQAAGSLSPGSSIGALTINSSLTNLGSVVMEVAKSGSALTSDSIRGMSTIVYGGILKLVLSGDALAANDSFKLFYAGAYQGTFASLVPATPGPGLSWDTTSLATDGTLKVVGAAAPLEIAEVSLVGTNLVMSGSGGTPGSGFSVITHTNIVEPLSNWTVIGTGTFDVRGILSFTNAIVPGTPQRFYLIRVP
jgi:autotransporter-associated beta strand protein